MFDINLSKLNTMIIIQLSLTCFLVPVLAQNCNSCYSFDSDSDVPDFLSANGWRIQNGEYVSGESPISSLSYEVTGPFEVSFNWKKNSSAGNSGLFLFKIDNNIPMICDGGDWSSVSDGRRENETHVLTWTVSKTRNEDFRGYLDSICIKSINCGVEPTIIFHKSEVRAGLIEIANVEDCGPGSRYIWSINGGCILSGQGTNSINWTAMDDDVDSVSIMLSVTKGNGQDLAYRPKNVAVVPNSLNVQNLSQLNEKINDTDNTTFYLSGNDALSTPIIINTTKYKNNRAFIHIMPLEEITVSLENEQEQDFVIAVDNSSNVSVNDLSFGNGKYSIIIENSTYVDFQRNDIRPTYDDGIYIKNSKKCNISYNNIYIRILDNESGFTLFNSQYNKLIRNRVIHNQNQSYLTVKFNITEDSNHNTVETVVNGNEFIFDDSGYQCHYYINGTCDCCCRDPVLCFENRLNGACITPTGDNIIGSRNKWIFSSV